MTRFFNIISLSAVATMFVASGVPTNALVADPHVARAAPGHHVAVAKKKRQNATCQPRVPPAVTSSAQDAASSTFAPPPATTSDAASSQAAPPPPPSSSAAAPPSSSAPPSSPSSSASAPASSAASSGSSSGSAKVGLAWPNGNNGQLQNFVTPNSQFVYDWGYGGVGDTSGLTYVPMCWGADDVEGFASTVVPGYSTHALGFNEPNEVGQSNMTPEQAAQLWQQYIQPLKNDGYTLVSPACSSRPNALPWMQQFMGNCTGCTVDIIAMHYYDITVDGFQSWVTEFYNTFNTHIWVTEFADQNFNGPAQQTQDEVNSYYSQMLSWFQETEWIDQYFAFGLMTNMQGVSTCNQLMNDDGTPTALGSMVINS
jgi:hypothetical protein